ncbi:MAG: hypothetical protein QOD62_2371 [Actinomycetota bacterium]|nr:hypothetical protein [Actinomycetota bacterium]
MRHAPAGPPAGGLARQDVGRSRSIRPAAPVLALNHTD